MKKLGRDKHSSLFICSAGDEKEVYFVQTRMNQPSHPLRTCNKSLPKEKKVFGMVKPQKSIKSIDICA
jgi:hypothetical protein